MIIPSFKNMVIPIPERRNTEKVSYRFVQSWLNVGDRRARYEVRDDCLGHGESDSTWPCLRLVGGFIRSNRCYAEGVVRALLGRPFSESVTIIQSKGEGQNAFRVESEDSLT
jgi:hypothetical protein